MTSKVFRSCVPALILAACILPGPALAILQKGEPAPPFKLVSTSGKQITLANYRGYVLLIDFFATWCSPCRDSIPHLVKLNRKYGGQGLQIIGLSLDEDGDKAVRVVEKFMGYNEETGRRIEQLIKQLLAE
jgi:thiol-disulfide isomerase/thioredoxin